MRHPCGAHAEHLVQALCLAALSGCASIPPIAQPNAVAIYQQEEALPEGCENLKPFRITNGRFERGYEEDGSRTRAFARLRDVVVRSGGNAGVILDEYGTICLDECAGSQYHISGYVLKCPSVPAGVGDNDRRRLSDARAKWLAARPANYMFLLRWFDFARPLRRDNVLIGVRANMPRYFLLPMPQDQALFDGRNTVDKLFDAVEHLLADPRWTARAPSPTLLVQYDLQFGYPRSVRMDPVPHIPDDEIVFVVYGFTVN